MAKPKQVNEVKTEQVLGEVKDDGDGKVKLEEESTEEQQDATEQSLSAAEKDEADVLVGDGVTPDATDDSPSVEGEKEEQPKVAARKPTSLIKVRYSPKHDLPGMLNGYQVQPGETHLVSEGEWMKVKENKDYKRVE